MPELSRILSTLERAAGQPAALATLVTIEGSSYRRPGARLLLLPDGTRVGSISGGCLEEDVLERARRVLASGEPELAVYDTTLENDLAWGVGTGCQGVVRIFIERLPAGRPAWIGELAANLAARRDTTVDVDYAGAPPRGTHLAQGPNGPSFRQVIPAPPALLICGAGDDARPLAQFAKETGWHVTVADTRPAYADRARFPQVDRLLTGPAAGAIETASPDARTFAIVMTHRYADDLAFLRALLPREFPYLGQLGPRPRTERLLAQLATEGLALPTAAFAKLHAPVGLDLGGNTPENVALAMLAEVQARFAGRRPDFLRERRGSIHGGEALNT